MKGSIFTDGGARGNPGPAASGAVLKDENKNTIDIKGKYLGTSTNNVAEYEGIILGLLTAKKHDITDLECFLDSELVVKQLKGLYKVKNEGLKELFIKVKALEKDFVKISYTHIVRALNKEADAVVNKVLDLKSTC